MEIRLDQVTTYNSCPMRYYFEYIAKQKVPDSEYDLFHRQVRQAVDYFLHSCAEGRIPTGEQLKQKWQALWFPSGTTIEDILAPAYIRRIKHKTENKGALGFEMLYNFYQTYKKGIGEVLAVEQEVPIKCGSHILLSKIELARISPTKRLDIINFTFSFKRNGDLNTFYANNDPRVIAAVMAFRQLFSKKEDAAWIHSLYDGLYDMKLDMSTQIRWFANAIEAAADGITNKRFWKNVEFHCRMCKFKDIC